MLGDIFTDYELVDMVTAGAAEATNWDNEVGIAPGMVADLRGRQRSPNYQTSSTPLTPMSFDHRRRTRCLQDTDIMTGLRGRQRTGWRFGKAVDVTFLAAQKGTNMGQHRGKPDHGHALMWKK